MTHPEFNLSSFSHRFHEFIRKKPTTWTGWLFVPLILEHYPSKSLTICAIRGTFLKFGVNHVSPDKGAHKYTT